VKLLDKKAIYLRQIEHVLLGFIKVAGIYDKAKRKLLFAFMA
jgi:hypothetical protein